MINSIHFDQISISAFQESQIFRTYLKRRNIIVQIQQQKINFISNQKDNSSSLQLFRHYRGLIINFSNIHNHLQKSFQLNENEKYLMTQREQYFIKFIEPQLNFHFIENIEYVSTQQIKFVLVHMNFDTLPAISANDQETIQIDLLQFIKEMLLKQLYCKIQTIQNTHLLKQLFQQFTQFPYQSTLIKYQLDCIQIFGNKQEIRNMFKNIHLNPELFKDLQFIVNTDASMLVKQQLKFRLLGLQVQEIGSQFLSIICTPTFKYDLYQFISTLTEEDDRDSYKSNIPQNQLDSKQQNKQFHWALHSLSNNLKQSVKFEINTFDVNSINFDLTIHEPYIEIPPKSNQLVQIMSQFTTNQLFLRVPYVSQQYRNYFHSLGIHKSIKIYFVTRNNQKYTSFPSNMVFYKTEVAAKNKFLSEKFYVLVEMLVYPKAKFRELKENPNQMCFKESNQVCPNIALYQI